MKHKILKTTAYRKISFFAAIIVSLFMSLLYYVSSIYFEDIRFNIIPLLTFAVIILIFTYFLFSFILKSFIYDKIRLIYKTIRKLKLQKDEKPETNLRTDILKEVKDEVEEWSEEHKKEISSLQEQESFRREYMGNISHELKNPIFNIQGYIYSLSEGAIKDTELTKKYLKRIEKNVDRIIDILEDLDIISKLETTDLKPNFKEFNLLELTRDVTELFADKADKKNIKIFFRENYSSPIIAVGDKSKIKQVLINLIDNAVKYNSENSRIKISFFDMDKNHLIEITDEGYGISEQDLPRVFERFYRTDKARSRDQGGTGLGLAIVKHIIEAHKQTINVRSTIGVGTTFAFTIKKA